MYHARRLIGVSTCCWPTFGYSILPETRHYWPCYPAGNTHFEYTKFKLNLMQLKINRASGVCRFCLTLPVSSWSPVRWSVFGFQRSCLSHQVPPRRRRRRKKAAHFLSSWRLPPGISSSKKGPHFAFCSLCSVGFTIDHGGCNDITRHWYLNSSWSSHHHLLLRHHVYNCMCVQACVISDVCASVIYPLSVG